MSAVRATEALEWWAATAASASLRKHLLPASEIPKAADRRTAVAFCGETRRQWQHVEEFARPDVFQQCPDCLTEARRVDEQTFTCPRCGRTSYNLNDVREGYCGACHDWTEPRTAAARRGDRLMDLSTITMERQQAREAFLAYRRAVRERHNAEDEQIMRGYRALARGQQLINLRETISAGGVLDNGLPRLAVAQADAHWVWVDRKRDGTVAFLPVDQWNLRANRRRGVTALPAGTLPVWSVDQVVDWRAWDGHWRAMVPIVPPPLRPAHALSNYVTLFEVEQWAPAPPPPGDPALLRHIGGELYAVVAIWDLTALEQAVLSARSLKQ